MKMSTQALHRNVNVIAPFEVGREMEGHSHAHIHMLKYLKRTGRRQTNKHEWNQAIYSAGAHQYAVNLIKHFIDGRAHTDIWPHTMSVSSFFLNTVAGELLMRMSAWWRFYTRRDARGSVRFAKRCCAVLSSLRLASLTITVSDSLTIRQCTTEIVEFSALVRELVFSAAGV